MLRHRRSPPRLALPACRARCRLPPCRALAAGPSPPPTLSPATAALAEGILASDRTSLSKAITLVESTRPQDGAQSRLLLQHLHSQLSARGAGPAFRCATLTPAAPCWLFPADAAGVRLGLCGPPGVGKSSLVETLGTWLLNGEDATPETGPQPEHRVAVLAVDPSSVITGGSILGDKTRMAELSSHPRAFVRPSPTRGVLGGVARKTEETLFLCEAAGYDIILVETVGVGQSETAVSSFVDMTALLVPPGGGDGLQGIKRGVMELADLVVVNKADGKLKQAASATRAEYRSVLQLMRGRTPGWQAEAVLVRRKPKLCSPTLHVLTCAVVLARCRLWSGKASRSCGRRFSASAMSRRRAAGSTGTARSSGWPGCGMRWATRW